MSTDKMEDDTGKSSYVIDSESESTVQTETETKKTFIFHREKYITESLANALGYSDESYTPFQKSEDLIKQLNENPTLLLLNGDSPEDLMHILNEVFGRIKSNRTPILIFSLSNPKSLINTNKNGFKELQECFDKKLLDNIHLPFDHISEIKNKIDKQKNAYKNNHKQSEEMWKKVAERRAEQQDISQRHTNKNLQAAKRILNGALRSGDYNLLNPAIEKKARDCYTQLISVDPTAKSNEIDEAMKLIDRAKNELASKNVTPETEIVPWHECIGSPLLGVEDILDWKGIRESLSDTNDAARSRIVTLVKERISDKKVKSRLITQVKLSQNNELYISAVVDGLNEVIKANDFYKENCFTSLEFSEGKNRVKNIIMGLDNLSESHLHRFNRKLIESLYPDKVKKTRRINKVLIIDDQKKIWEPVWKFILGERNIDIVEDGKDGLDKITNGGQYDCVLLDIDLGKDENGQNKENGIEVLQRIKHEQFDMPVIMMTAYDDTEIGRRCLELGAHSYFVKEREDNEDRNSVQYFRMIKKTLCSIKTCDSEERKSGREFTQIEGYFHNTYSEPCRKLKMAVFFLNLDPDETRAKMFLTGYPLQSHYVDIVSYAFACLEEMFDIEFRERQTEFLNRSTGLPLGLEYVSIEDKLKKIREFYPAMPSLKLIISYGPKTGHNIQKLEEDRFYKSNAIKCLREVITWCHYYFEEERTSKHKSEEFKSKPEMTIPYNHSREKRLKHTERARAGAIRLLLGSYLINAADGKSLYNRVYLNNTCNNINDVIKEFEKINCTLSVNMEIKGNCLFIDDDGEKSGWKTVLQLLLPNVKINYIEYTLSEMTSVTEEANNVDFIILDLKLPDKYGVLHEESGIELLESVKIRYPALPVIILTASDDALWMRKAFGRGSFGCFPKTNQDYYDVSEDKYYTDYFDRFIRIFKKLKIYLSSNVMSTYRTIESFKNNKIFRHLDDIISDEKKEILIDKYETVSKEVQENVYNELKKSLFYMSPDMSTTVQFLLKRLVFSQKGNNISCSQSILTATKVSEYLFSLLAYILTNDKRVFKLTINKIKSENPGIRKDYSNVVSAMDELWEKRIEAKENPSACDLEGAHIFLISAISFVNKTVEVINKIENTKTDAEVQNEPKKKLKNTSKPVHRIKKPDKNQKVPQSNSKQKVTNAERKTKGLITDPEEIKKLFLEMRKTGRNQ